MNTASHAYMLDTNVFSRIREGKIKIFLSFTGPRLLVTGVQEDELRATTNPEKQKDLISVIEKVKPTKALASSFCFDIEGAGFDQAEWNDGSGNFEKMLDRLKALDVKSKKKVKDCRNQIRDIVIAETAIKNDATLVSDDQNLRQVVMEFRGRAIDCSHFEREMAAN